MKLTPEQIERVVAKVLENLKTSGLVKLKADEKTILDKMESIFTKNLHEEDDLDREIEGMLIDHSSDVDSGAVDYRKIFNMVKHKLAKERGLIL